jgi:hypothetical protein
MFLAAVLTENTFGHSESNFVLFLSIYSSHG